MTMKCDQPIEQGRPARDDVTHRTINGRRVMVDWRCAACNRPYTVRRITHGSPCRCPHCHDAQTVVIGPNDLPPGSLLAYYASNRFANG